MGASPSPGSILKAEIGGRILAHVSPGTMDFAALPVTSSGHGRSGQLGQDTDPGRLCLLMGCQALPGLFMKSLKNECQYYVNVIALFIL